MGLRQLNIVRSRCLAAKGLCICNFCPPVISTLVDHRQYMKSGEVDFLCFIYLAQNSIKLKFMGGWSSKYIQHSKLSENGELDVGVLKTGDLLLFSQSWSKSKMVRGVRSINDRLWTTGGVILNNPALFSETMLLEYQANYPDDMLTNHLTLKNSLEGVRLVSVSERLQLKNFDACLVRTLTDKPSQVVQTSHQKVGAAMINKIQNHTFSDPAHMLTNSLRNVGLIEAKDGGLPQISLSDYASKKLNKFTVSDNFYSKGKIFVLE